MLKKVLFGLAIVLIATTPLAAAELEMLTEAPTSSVEVCAGQADALDARVELEPVSFKELAEGFLIPAGAWENCGQSGACNVDRNCFWMRPQCPLGTHPQCDDSTGSGCNGTCSCGWG